MRIKYNDTYELEVNLVKVQDKELYQLNIVGIDNTRPWHATAQEFFFEKHQLKQLIEYINGAANDLI